LRHPAAAKSEKKDLKDHIMEDVGENFDKAVLNIKGAAKQGAQIICTQELFKSPYFCQVEDPDNFNLAETLDESSPTIQILGELASELQIVLIASLFEKRAPLFTPTTSTTPQ